MGQTLTHGVYLPDEGERNCYSGLAANWQILDTSVGTIAANTAALSGKAPLVHTHTKSDITDFPAYGNAAGTICEGNDSRLSDARTPVAHTHIKSDVTDLLNSNFIPSANNSYDLGSSSYQWNNLYAKNYFYNGTAWGLDKSNTWSGNNTYSGNVNLYNSDNTQNTPTLYLRNSKATVSSSGNTAGYQGIYFNDSNNATLAYIRGAVQSNGCVVNLKTFVKDSNNNTVETGIQMGSFTDGSKWLAPLENGTISLGGTNYKWKTLNGINPGALSLPDFDNADPIDFRQWDVTGAVGSNYYTPTVDGWLNISIWDRATNSIFVYRSGYERVGVFGNGSMASDGRIALLMPVKANATYTIIIKASANSDIYSANFFPCLGNV